MVHRTWRPLRKPSLIITCRSYFCRPDRSAKSSTRRINSRRAPAGVRGGWLQKIGRCGVPVEEAVLCIIERLVQNSYSEFSVVFVIFQLADRLVCEPNCRRSTSSRNLPLGQIRSRRLCSMSSSLVSRRDGFRSLKSARTCERESESSIALAWVRTLLGSPAGDSFENTISAPDGRCEM